MNESQEPQVTPLIVRQRRIALLFVGKYPMKRLFSQAIGLNDRGHRFFAEDIFPDAEIYGVHEDRERDGFVVSVYHPSFNVVPEGEHPPWLTNYKWRVESIDSERDGLIPQTLDRMDGVPVTPHGLAQLLRAIEANDQKYEQRHWLVCFAVSVALRIGLMAGFRIDTEHKEWPVAYIELPTGQVSWHCPPHIVGWDGHTTEEKYRRIDAYCKAAL